MFFKPLYLSSSLLCTSTNPPSMPSPPPRL
jgi:hypothetical protein